MWFDQISRIVDKIQITNVTAIPVVNIIVRRAIVQ